MHEKLTPEYIIKQLHKHADNHMKNAQVASSEYLEGYHTGAAERLRMAARNIQLELDATQFTEARQK